MSTLQEPGGLGESFSEFRVSKSCLADFQCTSVSNPGSPPVAVIPHVVNFRVEGKTSMSRDRCKRLK